MILMAIVRGVSEERLAGALDVSVGQIKRKRQLLGGIYPETAELKHVSIHAFWQLNTPVPLRQIKAA